jgi:hypothetical protein
MRFRTNSQIGFEQKKSITAEAWKNIPDFTIFFKND